MILNISNATDYSIFNRLLEEGKIVNSFQMQKFNDNLIRGLSCHDKVVALSVLPYNDIQADQIEQVVGDIRYIGVKNRKGRLRRVSNVINLINEGRKIIKEEKPDCILCDAIASSPCYASTVLAKMFGIPSIGIITDLPGLLSGGQDPMNGIGRMQHFDGYVLLTEQMNAVVNPKNKPHIIMEGLCAPVLPSPCKKKASPRIILYTGSLWKHDAGIEYLTEGFIQANIPDCELHYYGVGELVSWLEEVNKKYPNVKYMGSRTNEEIVKKQCEATLLVNPRPSGEEFCKYSFPSKTIEYMASGTPVLMTRLPGVPEEYFEHVYALDDGTADGVCEKLGELFSLGNAALTENGMKARSYIGQNKNNNSQAERISLFIERLLARGNV